MILRPDRMRTGAPSLLAPWLLVFAVSATPAAADEMRSTGYRLQQPSLGETTGTQASQAYGAEESFGAPVTGALITPRFTVQLGRPPYDGVRMSPVLLTVTRGVDADAVDLAWTGNDAPFTIYRSTDCATVLTTALAFAQANGNVLTDPAPPAGALVCYNVRGTPAP